ncbi:hypothetical protein HWV62_28872 [Athelia sp. TMB]|nr:hypothetical protein HWV62_28872 [Athelia sp. TMB]
MLSFVSSFLLAAAPLAVLASYANCNENIGSAVISITTLDADAAANGPPFSMDFADSSVGSPLVVTSESIYDEGPFWTMTCSGQEYTNYYTDPSWPSSSAAQTTVFLPSVSSGLCITAKSLTDATTTLVSAPCDPDNTPGQLFQLTAGNFVDATLTLIGSQTMPTYLNNTSYSAALAKNGSSPQYAEITYSKNGVPAVTPSTVSLILTLQDD